MSEDDKMFRYLLKYVGKYRVLTELTTDTHDFIRDGEGEIHPDYDELYIPCAYEGKIKHTYTDSILSYSTEKKPTFKRVIKELDNLGIKYDIEDVDAEHIIYFNDEYLDIIAKLVGAKTAGKKISPFDKRNIPDRIETSLNKNITPLSVGYKIPTPDMSLYYSAVSSIKDTKIKREFNKNAPTDFIKSLKDETVEKSLKNSMLPVREFIHYSGMWGKYITFVKEKALLK